MGARYIEILAVQRPHPVALDAQNRVLFSMNFDAMADAPVADWEGDISNLIEFEGLAVRGVDMFTGPGVKIPAGNGPYTNIIDTGGNAPVYTQDDVKFERLSVQVVTRATDYVTARTLALAIWRLLDGLRDTTVADAAGAGGGDTIGAGGGDSLGFGG